MINVTIDSNRTLNFSSELSDGEIYNLGIDIPDTGLTLKDLEISIMSIAKAFQKTQQFIDNNDRE